MTPGMIDLIASILCLEMLLNISRFIRTWNKKNAVFENTFTLFLIVLIINFLYLYFRQRGYLG